MIPALIVDGILFATLHTACAFGFEMSDKLWNVWKAIGWLVVVITAIEQGGLIAAGLLLVLSVPHRLLPLGWTLVGVAVILFTF